MFLMMDFMYFVLLFLGLTEDTFAEMYSSMASIQQAVSTEKVLLRHLETYLEQETHRLNDLRRFYDKIQAFHAVTPDLVADPIVAYTFLKRLHLEWLNVVHSLEATENIQALKDGYEEVEKHLPIFEDVEGAAKALMRLQDVYSLNVNGMARGKLQRAASPGMSLLHNPVARSTMSADDCFHVGKVAYEMNDYYHSIPWLEEAVSMFRGSHGNWFTEDEGSLEDALDYLAFSYYKAGNISQALDLSREFLLYDPGNKRVARNIAKYEKILDENPVSSTLEEIKIQRPNATHVRTRDLYEGLCRNLGKQPIMFENPKMFCTYDTNGSPLLTLQPLKKEMVSLDPYVVLYHDFLSDLETETIKEIAAPWVKELFLLSLTFVVGRC